MKREMEFNEEKLLILAEKIRNRIILIGTIMKHMETIKKYSTNKYFSEAFVIPYLALQSYLNIELFKLFDTSGKDTKDNNIYALIEKSGKKEEYYKRIQIFKDEINKIKQQRNYYFAHDTEKNIAGSYEKNRFEKYTEMLKVLSKICCEINDKLMPSIYCDNGRIFDDWCYNVIESINTTVSYNEHLSTQDIYRKLNIFNMNDILKYFENLSEM